MIKSIFMSERKLTNNGALKTILLLRAINRYGIEMREQIKEILERVDLDGLDEKTAWEMMEKELTFSDTGGVR